MTRVAYGRIREVSAETGLAKVELRPASATAPSLLASCELPQEGSLPQPGELVEILILPGSEVIDPGSNAPQREVLGSLDRMRALTGFRRLCGHVGSDREFEATLVRREGRVGWILRLEGWEGFAPKDPPRAGKDHRPAPGDRSTVQLRRFVRERGNFLVHWSERLRHNVVRAVTEGISVGDVVPGRVNAIESYGAFVEVTVARGSFTALLPNAEAAWQSNARVGDVLQRGSSRDFRVVKIVESPAGERRIVLSLRALFPSPWEQYGEDLALSDQLTGTVVNVTDYGAFVELLPGLDALLHRTQMLPPCKVGETHGRFSVGAQVWCKISKIDAKAKRIWVQQAKPEGV